MPSYAIDQQYGATPCHEVDPTADTQPIRPDEAPHQWPDEEPTRPDIRPESCTVGDIVAVLSKDGQRQVHTGSVERLWDRPIAGVVRTMARVFGLSGEYPLTQLRIVKRKGG